MLLPEQDIHTETSQTIKDYFFGIKDQSIIFDILRTKIYEDPIIAIVREISCNARDAHREVNNDPTNPTTSETPIEIILPNDFDKYFTVIDHGPGISESRMSEIFTQYAASTKRNDNSQTGGYGLGCKTPFSYSDIFIVTTVVDGRENIYQAYIDESKLGKVILTSSEVSDKPNGTKISIPVKKVDVEKFTDAVFSIMRHWEPRPIVDCKIDKSFIEINKLVETPGDWFVSDKYSYGHNLLVLLDGIPYHVNCNEIIKPAHNNQTYIIANTGDISVSASRDTLTYDKKTIDFFNNKVAQINCLIPDIINNKIQSCNTIKEVACIIKGFGSIIRSEKVNWNNQQISTYAINIPGTIIRSKDSSYATKFKTRNGISIDSLVNKNVIIVHAASQSKLSQFTEVVVDHTSDFGESPHIIGIIGKEPPTKSLEIINDIKTHDIDEVLKKYNVQKISKERAPRQKIAIYSIDFTENRNYDAKFEFTPLSEMPEEGIYVICDARNTTNVSSGDISFTASSLSEITKVLGINIYGVNKSKESKLNPDEWTPLSSVINETLDDDNILKNYAISFTEFEYDGFINSLNTLDPEFKYIKKISKEIDDEIRNAKEASKINTIRGLCGFIEGNNERHNKIDEFKKAINLKIQNVYNQIKLLKERYPLYHKLDKEFSYRYYSERMNQLKEGIEQYIDLVYTQKVQQVAAEMSDDSI